MVTGDIEETMTNDREEGGETGRGRERIMIAIDLAQEVAAAMEMASVTETTEAGEATRLTPIIGRVRRRAITPDEGISRRATTTDGGILRQAIAEDDDDDYVPGLGAREPSSIDDTQPAKFCCLNVLYLILGNAPSHSLILHASVSLHSQSLNHSSITYNLPHTSQKPPQLRAIMST